MLPIKPLVALLRSSDLKTQEYAVISLLNLSITDNKKAEIAAPCECATGWTMRHNGKMQLQPLIACHFLCITRCNTICSSGAIPPLVHPLINGTPHEKKEGCCHSSSLTSQYYMRTRDTLCSRCHQNPCRACGRICRRHGGYSHHCCVGELGHDSGLKTGDW